jgi:hypothetical protein
VGYWVRFWGVHPSPPNSEVFTKLSRTPSPVENTSATNYNYYYFYYYYYYYYYY